MFSSLRGRLLLSYVAIIGLTLCIVSIALILLLLRNPAPTRDAYNRLNNIARESLPRLKADIEKIDDNLTRHEDR